jgi:hypothetical protein
MIRNGGRMINWLFRPLGVEIRISPTGRKTVKWSGALPPSPAFSIPSGFLTLLNPLRVTFVEGGVGYGYSMLLFAFLVKDEMRGRTLRGFDSFEGFPEPMAEDNNPRNAKRKEWGNACIMRVPELLLHAGLEEYFVRTQVTSIIGYFEKNLADM